MEPQKLHTNSIIVLSYEDNARIKRYLCLYMSI